MLNGLNDYPLKLFKKFNNYEVFIYLFGVSMFLTSCSKNDAKVHVGSPDSTLTEDQAFLDQFSTALSILEEGDELEIQLEDNNYVFKITDKKL